MSNLTAAQIQQIFDFTAQKYIKYYVVQLELVDHIANRIEELQAEDPKLSFESALQKVYKSFGVYGFTKVQEQKVHQMETYWRGRFWSYYMAYFRLPKIVLTIGLTVLFNLYLILMAQFFPNSLVLYITAVFILIISTLLSHHYRRINKKQLASKYLMINSFATTIQGIYIGGIVFMPMLANLIMIDGEYASLSLWGRYFGALLLSFLVINHHAMHYVFPNWLKSEIDDNYTHLDITAELTC